MLGPSYECYRMNFVDAGLEVTPERMIFFGEGVDVSVNVFAKNEMFAYVTPYVGLYAETLRKSYT